MPAHLDITVELRLSQIRSHCTVWLKLHRQLPHRRLYDELGPGYPSPVGGVAGDTTQPVSTHLSDTPVCVPVPHADGDVVDRSHFEHSISTDATPAVAPARHRFGARIDWAIDNDEVVAQSLHLHEVHDSRLLRSSIAASTRRSGSANQGNHTIRGSR